MLGRGLSPPLPGDFGNLQSCINPGHSEALRLRLGGQWAGKDGLLEVNRILEIREPSKVIINFKSCGLCRFGGQAGSARRLL